MKRIVAVVLGLSAAGCFEVEQEFTLNPDGSGKVVVHWIGPSMDVLGQEKDPDEQVASSIRRQLEGAKGVECWTDVSWKELKDGRIEFTGTAYFRDLKSLDLAIAGATPGELRFALARAEGGLVLTPVLAKADEKKEREAPPANEAELKKRVRRERQDYQRLRPLLEAVFGRARQKTTVNLPADVASSACFTKRSARSLELAIDGAKLLRVMDALMADDRRLEADLAKGIRPMEAASFEEAFGVPLFGEKGPVRAVTRGEGAPLIDIDKELTEERRAAFRKLCRTLGVTPPKAEAAGPEPLPVPAKASSEVLRSLFALDLSQPWPLRCTATDDLSDLADALKREGQAFDIDTIGADFSSRGKDGFRLRVDGDGVREFELRPATSNVLLHVRQQGDHDFQVVVESGRFVATLVSRGTQGVALTVLRQGSPLARTWASMGEALRGSPADFVDLVDVLEALPLTGVLTCADRRVMRLSVAWHEGPSEAERAAIRSQVEWLGDDDVGARDGAAKRLREWAAAEDLQRIRVLVGHLSAMKPGEARTRLQGIVAEHARAADAVRFVETHGLHKDLEFLGAVMEVDARAAASRIRELTGVDMTSRAEFEAWYRRVKDRLEWDEAKGRYRVKE